MDLHDVPYVAKNGLSALGMADVFFFLNVSQSAQPKVGKSITDHLNPTFGFKEGPLAMQI